MTEIEEKREALDDAVEALRKAYPWLSMVRARDLEPVYVAARNAYALAVLEAAWFAVTVEKHDALRQELEDQQ